MCYVIIGKQKYNINGFKLFQTEAATGGVL